MYEAQYQPSPFFHLILWSLLRIFWKSRFSTFPLKTPDSSSARQKPQQNEMERKNGGKKLCPFGREKVFTFAQNRRWTLVRSTTLELSPLGDSFAASEVPFTVKAPKVLSANYEKSILYFIQIARIQSCMMSQRARITLQGWWSHPQLDILLPCFQFSGGWWSRPAKVSLSFFTNTYSVLAGSVWVCVRVFFFFSRVWFLSLVRTISDFFCHFRPPTHQTSTITGSSSSSQLVRRYSRLWSSQKIWSFRPHAVLQTADGRPARNTAMITAARLFYCTEQSSCAPVSRERRGNKCM